MATVKSTFNGLEGLNITKAGIRPGTAGVAFLIPRDLFDNQLGMFAKELGFINSLIRNFSEATTGEAESVELDELSSSVPTLALIASAVAVRAIAETANKFLDAWKKVEEIREIRERLKKIGMKVALLEELDGQISSTVEEVVEESRTTLIEGYKGGQARKNELSNALDLGMHRLFGQIERGMTLEFNAEAKEDEQDEVNRKALEAIATLGRKMSFPQIANEPLLLTNGEVVEDPLESVKVYKKTTVRKSTKKETLKETRPETKEGL